MAIPKFVGTLALVIGTLCLTPAMAQVQRSGGGGNAALMQQYQQMASERTQLQADNAKLKRDLDDLKKQLDAAKQALAASKAGASRGQAAALAAAQAAVQTANENNAKAQADLKGKLQELVGRFRETATQLRGVETERADLQQQLLQSKADLDKCAQRNYDLYQVDREVLDRYQNQSVLGYMARAEPFTRIKRTQIDNFVLEYKERAEALRVKQAGGSTPAPAAAPAAQTPSSASPR